MAPSVHDSAGDPVDVDVDGIAGDELRDHQGGDELRGLDHERHLDERRGVRGLVPRATQRRP